MYLNGRKSAQPATDASGGRDYRRPFTGEKLDTSNIEALAKEAKDNGGRFLTPGNGSYTGY
jgi:hypothetical protein